MSFSSWLTWINHPLQPRASGDKWFARQPVDFYNRDMLEIGSPRIKSINMYKPYTISINHDFRRFSAQNAGKDLPGYLH